MAGAAHSPPQQTGLRQFVAVLVTGMLLSLALGVWVSRQVELRAEARFQQLSDLQQERIHDRLETFVYSLQGVRGLFQRNPDTVTAEEFRNYLSRDLQQDLTGALAWGYVQRLPAGAAAGRPRPPGNYHRLDGLTQPPAGQEAWVLRLLEPQTPVNATSLGLDIGSEPQRRALATESMRTGRAILSPPMALAQDPNRPGFLLLLPVYTGAQVPDNVAGWVLSALSATDLLAFLGNDATLGNALDISIADATAPQQPFFRLHPEGLTPVDARLHRMLRIGIGGRQWELQFSGLAGLYAPADRWLPALVAGGGLLLTLIVAGMLLLSGRRRHSAEHDVMSMTRSLREREVLLQSTLAPLDEWVFVLDASGRVLDCHEPEHHGQWLPRAEFLTRPLTDLLPPPVAATLREKLDVAMTTGRARFEFSLSQDRGPHFTARLCARHHDDGSTEGVTLIVQDVTREHEQARALRESEQKFRLLFTEAAQAIMLTRHGRYVDANPVALTLFGIPNLATLQHASLGMISPLMQPDGRPSAEAVKDIMRKAAEEGPQHYEWTFQRLSDGATFPADVHTSCMTLDGAMHFLSMITDLSSRKQTELALIQARDAAEAATREKSDFLATMSHEIRTPMNGVLGMAQLLGNSPLNPEQREYLGTIQQSGQALLTIINDILDFSKIEAGKLSFEETPFDLQVAIDETCELLLPEVREKNLELRLDLDPATPFNVIGDPGRFRQILLNYLSNALKFTQQGGITISLRARERGRGAVHFELAVADTGIGISHEQQRALFQKFSQADRTTTRRFGGTGLGLAICKALVERMGGSVSMSSVPGHGSTFRANFWMSPDPDAVHQGIPAIAASLRSAPVLVVDDMASHREPLVRGLGKAGLSATGAASIAEGLRLAQEQLPRFVICAAELPDGDAPQLASSLRAVEALAGTVFVMLSCRLERNDHAFCREHHIAASLPRPARVGWIISCLNMLASGEHDGIITRHSLLANPLRGKALPALRPGMRVLVAEDNAVNQKVAARMLERMGCHVDMAGNGLEALVMVSQLPYDVVLMDVQMPEMDGITATRSLRAQGFADLPIIALTANNREADREECRAAGMSDFLAKPIRYEDLHACLSRWL
jgi:PAS domain S-box-containing protein